MKPCANCGEEYPITFFHKSGNGKRRSSCKYCRRERRRLGTYGVTPGEYEMMLDAQGGGCGICGTLLDLVVDHCHHTGEVRGILCRKCNSGIGLLSDNPILLLTASNWTDPSQRTDAQRALSTTED